MTEIELKFGVPEAAAAAVSARLAQLGAKTLRIESRYWDTADQRLSRAGISLRVRSSDGQVEQTVKTAPTNAVERVEETVALPVASAADAAPEAARHRGSRADRALAVALGSLDAPPPLVLVHASIVERSAVIIDVAGAQVEIAFDRGEVRTDQRSSLVREVEFELKRGDASALIAFGRASIDAHGMWLSTTSKAVRGNRLAAAESGASRAVKARPVALAGARSGTELFRVLVANCADQILANASVLAEGEIDDDVIHQLRVGIRRLRTVWRELAGWRGALGPQWEGPLADLFRTLGALRDRKTVVASVQARLAAAGSPDPNLQPRAGDAPPDPVRAVRRAEVQHAMLDVVEFLLATAAPAPGSEREDDRDTEPHGAKAGVALRLDRLHAHLRRNAKRFELFDDARRHRARKQLKRLRYLSELTTPLFKRGAVERYLEHLQSAQDDVGHYMDLVVATPVARQHAEAGGAGAWFNLGWLNAESRLAVERCAKSLRRAAAAKPYWHAARHHSGDRRSPKKSRSSD